MLSDESSKERNLEAKRQQLRLSVESQLRNIVLEMAPDFAAAAKQKSGLFTRSWSFWAEYDETYNGEGYRDASRAWVTITRGGSCEVTAKSAGYGRGSVNDRLVKYAVTKALAGILKGTK